MKNLKQLIEQVVAEELRDIDEDLEQRQAFAQDLKDMGLGHSESGWEIEDLVRIGRPIKQLFHKHADHKWLSTLTTIHFMSDSPSDFFASVSHKDELSCGAFLPGQQLTRKEFWRSMGVVVKGRITLLANHMDDIYSGYGSQYTEKLPTRSRDSGANKGVEQRRPADEYAYDDEPAIFVFDEEDFDATSDRNEALVDNWRPVAVVFRAWPDENSQKWLEEEKERLKKQGVNVPLLSLEEFNKIA